jgi:protein TonB
MNELPDP